MSVRADDKGGARAASLNQISSLHGELLLRSIQSDRHAVRPSGLGVVLEGGDQAVLVEGEQLHGRVVVDLELDARGQAPAQPHT